MLLFTIKQTEIFLGQCWSSFEDISSSMTMWPQFCMICTGYPQSSVLYSNYSNPCYKALNDVGPHYRKDLLPLAKDKGKGPQGPFTAWRSQTHCATYGVRSFSAAGHRDWNNLPLSIRQSPTVSSLIPLLRHICSRLSISASDTYLFCYMC